MPLVAKAFTVRRQVAFTAITGKHVYTRIHIAPFAKDIEAYAFLKGGCTDTAFMRENEISIVIPGGHAIIRT